jgi:hypothetical protein
MSQSPGRMFAQAFSDRAEIDRITSILTNALDWFEKEGTANVGGPPPLWVTDAMKALGRKPR